MKKLLSILLVLVLCTGLMAMTVSAAEGGYAIGISSHEVKEGTKTVTVTVTMTENDGLGALTVNPVYDANVLKLVNGGDADGDYIADCWTTEVDWYVAEDTGAVYVDARKGTSYTGTLATFEFEVLQEVDTTVTVKASAALQDETVVDVNVGTGSIKFICLHKTGTDSVETPATCEEAGKIEYVCKKCGEVTKTETIKALGHTKGEAVTENEVAATCETAGSKDTVVYCTVCEKEVSRKTETIKALGHTKGEAVTENEVAATCEKDGSKDIVVYCTVCEKEVSRKTETTKAIGHKWDNGQVTGEAKCGEPGEMTYTCQNDASHTRTEKMDALAHILDEGKETTAPTCTEKGVMTYTCTRGCGHTETKEIPALGHTEAEAVKENEVAPTCTEKGSYDEVVYCSVCNEKLSTKTVSVDALGHKWAEEGTVKTPATCYAEGVMSYACTAEGCSETKEVAIEKTKHTVTKWSHEDAVYCVGTCDVAECGAEVKERHNVLEYTKNEDGEYVGPCTTCGKTDVNRGDMIPAGDITPMLVMGGVAVLSMLAAAAYVTCRKFAK